MSDLNEKPRLAEPLSVLVDRTSNGKEHFEALDGLRGSAAFLIVIFSLSRIQPHAPKSITGLIPSSNGFVSAFLA
jgi:peptidoglycan/LPS O-acetylase OafA/YrhL